MRFLWISNIQQQKPEEPQWLTWLRIGYYTLKIADFVIKKSNEKHWDENVQRYRYNNGQFAKN